MTSAALKYFVYASTIRPLLGLESNVNFTHMWLPNLYWKCFMWLTVGMAQVCN